MDELKVARYPSKVARWVGMSVLVVSLPACQSLGWHHNRWTQPESADSSNVVYRPAYELPGTKPLFVSGYAGNDYGPMRPRRGRWGGPAPLPSAEVPGITAVQGSWDTE
jgi:hypothetical protein